MRRQAALPIQMKEKIHLQWAVNGPIAGCSSVIHYHLFLTVITMYIFLVVHSSQPSPSLSTQTIKCTQPGEIQQTELKYHGWTTRPTRPLMHTAPMMNVRSCGQSSKLAGWLDIVGVRTPSARDSCSDISDGGGNESSPSKRTHHAHGRQ